ncbi:MAG: ATP-binding cassette domain-containing protein [Acidimicrobiia bacterium]
MPDSILAAGSVTYRVGVATLVADVDFEAAAGEFVGVIGPNGAGKTTLLSLLAGDTIPDEGWVTIGGSSTAEIPISELASLRSVLADYVPLDIPFTVRAVVEMGRFPHRRDPENSQQQDEAAVFEAMDRTDTAMLEGRIFSTLSSGERARSFLPGSLLRMLL